ncbi:MAG: CsgG/HfaB family protein [Pseudomonadota bacterium]
MRMTVYGPRRPKITRAARCLCLASLTFLGACAVAGPPTVKHEGKSSRDAQIKAQKAVVAPESVRFKRKIAIGRFSNETRYGRSLLRDQYGDPLGKQALDILSNQLVATGRFLVFERPDLGKLEAEQRRFGNEGLVGVDALILGSITAFGRSTTGQSGFLSSTKKQVARAKVDIRLADVETGHVFFSTSGAGEATTESGEVAGFGSRARYDATLNDKALTAAISETVNQLVTKLEARPWRTDILKVEGDRVFISGGESQGLKKGDQLAIMREGEKVKSGQSGMTITLPGTEIGRIRIESLFGDTETNEGSVGRIVQGALPPKPAGNVYVAEVSP